MIKRTVEFIVGIFVIISFVCIGYLTFTLGKVEFFSKNHYKVKARFSSVSGLKKRAVVEIAGVGIGHVDSVVLEPKTQNAIVTMKINKGIALTDDVIASVKTAGLIGDKYIKLSPGGSDIFLEDGDMITETESVLDVEELISKYAFGGL